MRVKVAMKTDLLLVDDEKVEAMLFRHYFEETPLHGRMKYFEFAEDFLDYMQKVKQGEVCFPKLILLDIRMTSLSGFEVLKRIREDANFEVMPAIMMYSNSKEEADIKKALALGANDYKTKPCGKSEYLMFIDFLIRRIGE